MPNIDPPPFFAMLLNSSGKINRYQIAIHLPPGINMTEAGVYPVAGRREDALVIRVPHLITPETEHSAHYHWGVCRNFRPGDEALTEGIRKATSHTFDEDKAMLEIQDAALRAEGMPDLPRAAIKVDVAPMRARKLLADFARAEGEDPRAVLAPAALARDDVVSWPPAA
jgi:vanillate O-demethylase monooxygenase subunit